MKPRVLLLACYELGHQPLSLAWPLAFLKDAGYLVRGLDLAVAPFSDEAAAQATFVGISAPMHTALRLGVRAAARIRAVNPLAHICLYGSYAWLNADYLLNGRNGVPPLVDSVVAGEYELPLLELVRALDAGDAPTAVPGVATASSRSTPHLARLTFPVPDRASLPPPERYAHYVHNGRHIPAGYTEASRGCLHTCRHCPVVPVYGGRFFVIPLETVLADVRQQVAAGAGHITLGDPDFLNGPGHALKVTRALHAEFPDVTFDFTTRVEHILERRELFPEFATSGCSFVVSAIESLSDRVLARLEKGHTAADIVKALGILDAAGIEMQPTLVAFTPWTALDDYLALIEFIRERGLQRHIPPVQLSIRLLIPPGSALLSAPDADEWAGELDPGAFTYRWVHPDPRMDRLCEQVSDRVALAEESGEPPLKTFAAIRALAYAAAGRPLPADPAPPAIRPAPPRLTEDWFC